MGVDAKVVARNTRCNHFSGNTAHISGQGAAVGVTQRNPARAVVKCGFDRFQRVLWVVLVAVKEVFGVKDRLAPLLFQIGKTASDVVGVFIQLYAQRGFDVKFVGFADQTDRRRIGIDHRRQHIVVFRRDTFAFGHPECGHRSAGFWGLVKERAVGWVGTRPTTLDVIDAQRI